MFTQAGLEPVEVVADMVERGVSLEWRAGGGCVGRRGTQVRLAKVDRWDARHSQKGQARLIPRLSLLTSLLARLT